MDWSSILDSAKEFRIIKPLTGLFSTLSQLMLKREIYNGKESSATLSLMSRALSNVLVSAETFAFQCVEKNEGVCSDSNAVYANPSHRIYCVQAQVCELLFREFEDPSFGLEACNTNSSINTQDWYFQEFQKFYYSKPDELLEDPNFGTYLDRTSKLLLKEEYEGKTEDLLFVNLVKAIWALHKLAFSFNPKAIIFRLESGQKFDALRMEQVFEQEDEDEKEIAFMVLPGFVIGNHIFKARVYIGAGNTAVGLSYSDRLKLKFDTLDKSLPDRQAFENLPISEG